MPVAIENLQQPGFTMALLHGLHVSIMARTCPEADKTERWAPLALSAIFAPDLSAIRGSQGEPAPGTIKPRTMALFLADLLSLNPQEESKQRVESLCMIFHSQAGSIPASEFPIFWVPMLRQFLAILVSNRVVFTTPACGHIVTAILEAYVNNYVGSKPVENKSLVREPVSCACTPCKALNDFPQDPVSPRPPSSSTSRSEGTSR